MTLQRYRIFSGWKPSFLKSYHGIWICGVLCALLLTYTYLTAVGIFPIPSSSHKLEDIFVSGELRMITLRGESSYIETNNIPSGFEYEMALAFADELGVQLSVKTYDTWEEMVEALNADEGDFIAANLMITPERKAAVDFSDEYLLIQQQIIVRQNHAPIQSAQDLTGQTVHVQKGSSAESWLKELQGEGYLFSICTDVPDDKGSLVEQVIKGNIDIAVSNDLALEEVRLYCPELVSTGVFTGRYPIAWAVKKGASDLLGEMNQFLQSWETLQQMTQLYTKYNPNKTEKQFGYIDVTAFKKRIHVYLPRYKHIIQHAADKYGIDWRLIAALIYQESQFNPMATHYRGEASGLMQITRATAERLGVTDISDPYQNIEAGVRYLNKMKNMFPEASKEDQIYFCLAAYNIGIAHVKDAQTLASQQGLNPNEWSDVERVLPLLKDPRYYRTLRYGYGNGELTVYYVKKIRVYHRIMMYLNL